MNPENHATSPAAKPAAGNLLTDVEVAQLLGTALQTVRNWRTQGEGPRYAKLGRRMGRYRPADVTAFIRGEGRQV